MLIIAECYMKCKSFLLIEELKREELLYGQLVQLVKKITRLVLISAIKKDRRKFIYGKKET